MALPTAAECKLQLSINMVTKTMTATVQEDIAAAGMSGLIYTLQGSPKIVDPFGTEYPITDIGYDGTTGVGSQTWNAPVDSTSGNVINGDYKILLPEVFVDDGTIDSTYEDVDSEYTLNYTAPVVKLSQVVDCISPSFKSNDITDYRVIDPTSQGYITPVTVSYAHNLYYPVTSDGYPNNTTETSDLSIARGAYQFYIGTQTGTVSHAVSYTFVDGLVVLDTIKGDLETKVKCDTLLCDIVCGLNKMFYDLIGLKKSDFSRFLQVQAEYEWLWSIASNAQSNINCGNNEEAQTQIDFVKEALGDCCSSCALKDGDLVCGAANPVFPFTPENVANKSTTIVDDTGSDIKYPSVKAVEDYVESKVVPYKSIVALVTQAGTSNPSWTVLQSDDISATFTLTRSSAGVYVITSSTAIFTANKTIVFFNLDHSHIKIATASWTSTTTITISVVDDAGVPADVFTNASIEIRIYS